MLEQWFSFVIVILFNIGVLVYMAGKFEQKVKDQEAGNQKQFISIDRDTAELFRLNREHEQSDQRHFNDTDAHWNRREREWLNKRFDIIEAMLKGKE